MATTSARAFLARRRDRGGTKILQCRPRRAHDNEAEPLGATLRSISWAARGTHRAFLPYRCDHFNSLEMARVFVIEPSQGLRQTLIIPRGTFEPEGAK